MARYISRDAPRGSSRFTRRVSREYCLALSRTASSRRCVFGFGLSIRKRRVGAVGPQAYASSNHYNAGGDTFSNARSNGSPNGRADGDADGRAEPGLER